MYCEKCHRQSPDNFDSCAYCSAAFEKKEEQKPSRFVKPKKKRKRLSRKSIIIILVSVAFVLTVAAIVAGVLKGAKPETAVKSLAQAIEAGDPELYFSLFDSQIREYKKANWYFNDEETFKAMAEPLEKSVNFYSEVCGEQYSVSYKISKTEYLSEEELDDLIKLLEDTYSYSKLPTQAARLDFELNVSGDSGEYKSVYRDFYCIKIGGRWYKTDVLTAE